MLINGNMPIRFKPTELHHFNWLYSVAPCFAVNASKINIITDPRNFYDTLCDRFKNARRRISVASLYIGTGPMEQTLVDVTKENVQKRNLKFSVLLDYQRGTRGEVNSRTLLQDFVKMGPNCAVSMYQTPRLHGSWSKILPARYNELVGVQHMKLYIADDSVLLSGANCSNDYFRQRQDRYFKIEDGDLADFYCELIDEVSNFSKKCMNDSIEENIHGAKKDLLVQEVNMKIKNLIERWRERQQEKLLSFSGSGDTNKDTWVFPLIQMGEFNITQDEQATRQVLASVPKGSYIRLATGYFNLTDQYAKALLKECKANISLLMAHPNANGFMGASGPAGGIPHAYSLIARKFWQRVVDSNQASRVRMLEYERAGWTFHAKGLCNQTSKNRDNIYRTYKRYYPPGSGVPWATIVGSANLGERSVRRDLEAQAAIFTVSPELQERLHDECCQLHKYASECTSDLRERHTPLWVRATVGLFRTYF